MAINVWGDYLWPTIVIQDPQPDDCLRRPGAVRRPVSGPISAIAEPYFAAYVIVTAPMFLLDGFTMRYFVSGLTEGALKL